MLGRPDQSAEPLEYGRPLTTAELLDTALVRLTTAAGQRPAMRDSESDLRVRDALLIGRSSTSCDGGGGGSDGLRVPGLSLDDHAA